MKKIAASYISFLVKMQRILLPIFLLMVVGFAISLFYSTLDLTTEGFLFPDDPVLAQYAEFQKQYGNDGVILFAITGNPFSNDYLKKIQQLQNDIEASIPYVKKTTSIINVPQIYTEKDEYGMQSLYVDDLFKNFPEELPSNEELKVLKQRVLQDPVFVNQIISEDGRTSTILVELYSRAEIDSDAVTEKTDLETDSFEDLDALFDDAEMEDSQTDSENAAVETAAQRKEMEAQYSATYLSNRQNMAVYSAAQTLLETYSEESFTIALVGFPLLVPTMITALLQDVLVFIPLLLLAVIIFIKIMFKRFSAIIFSMLVAGLTNVSVLGIMALTGTSITLISNVIPVIMISISMGAVVHLLVLVYGRFDAGSSKEEALRYAFTHSGWPILLTGLTSAAGIFSFYFSSIKPIQDFGLYGSIGLLFSLLFTMVFVPLLMLKLPIKRLVQRRNRLSQFLDSILSKHARTAYKNRLLTLLISVFLIALSFFGVKEITFSHAPIEWLPLNSTYREDTKAVDRVMKGSNFLELFIDTEKDGEIYEVAFLSKVERLEEFLYAYSSEKIQVGNVRSLVSIIKKTNQELNGGDPRYYSIPNSRELVAQELLLLENGGADTLSAFVDLNYRYFRMSIVLPDLNAIHFSKFLRDVEQEMHSIFADTGYHYYSTGSVALLSRIIDETISSARMSYLVAFFVITMLMILLTRKISIGLVSMVPNLLPIFVLLAIVAVSSINLDMFILLIGCVLLGIAVDNTIHFVHVYRQYYFSGQNIEESIRLTFLSTGKAMLTSSIILMAGFSVFIFASMRNFHNFGILALIGVLVALFSDFFLTPALMSYLTRAGAIKRR